MRNSRIAIGVDIGGTNTKIGLIDEKGTLLLQSSLATNKDCSPDEFIHLILKEVEQSMKNQLNQSLSNDPLIVGVGVGAPMANFENGSISFAPNLNWRNVPLQDHFTKAFRLPVFVENDANLAAMGEKKWGAGKNLKHFVMITLGTGVGTGLILNGQIFRGNQALGGEGGHVLIPHNGLRKCSCGGFNHLESFLSSKGIKQTIKEMTEEDWNIEELGKKFNEKDPRAVAVLNEVAEELARGLETMSVLLAPEAFIIGGGISQLGEQFESIVESKLNLIVHYSLKEKIRVISSQLSGKNGAIFGGAALVFEETKSP